MKKLILASIAVAATLASCEKISEVDMAITSKQSTMNFTAYASGATTKGNPVDSNTEFEATDESGNSFMVSAYFTATSNTDNTGKYFAFSEVAYDYDDSEWENVNDMYWPNEAGNLYFGAYYPKGATFGSTESTATTPSYEYSKDGHALEFGYTVEDKVADQIDLMYAIKTLAYGDSESGTTIGSESAVNLHFKHALTQVGFTATADDDISVTVSSITVCNIVDNGTFSASEVTDDSENDDETVLAANVDTDNFGGWAVGETFENYAVAMAFDDDESVISVGSETTTLTKADDALMLIPQALTAWTPDTSASTTDDSGSYLAIKCSIKHAAPTADAEVDYASIIDGYVFVPFSTADIKYEDTNTTDGQWNPGYKITYNLHFGGGYTVPGVDDESELPEPGETPDDLDEDTDPIETLRAITYTISVDEWISVSGGTVSFGTSTES